MNPKNHFNTVIIIIIDFLKTTNIHHVILKIIQFVMMIKYYNLGGCTVLNLYEST
jgi:hypothetical protein